MHPSQTTDLQLLQAMSYDSLPRVSINETIPMAMDVTEADVVHFDAQADKHHLNPLGSVHGNFMATVLDSMISYTVHSMLETDVDHNTVDLNVRIVEAVSVDMPLVAARHALHLSCMIDMSESALKMQDGILLVYTMVACVIHRP